MSEHQSNVLVKIGSEKSFGIFFAFIFMVIGFLPLIEGNSPRLWALSISILFLMLAIFSPRTLKIPNKLWFKFGMLLGGIVAPIIITLLYFLTVTPTGIIMRLLGKDLLRQQFNSSIKSYWIERKKSLDTMKNQF